MGEIKPIKRQKLSDEVYQRIKDNIIQEVWKPGTTIPSENALCEMFGVSRSTVRAAMHKLVAVGMVETRNGKGTCVIDRNISEVWGPIIQNLTTNGADILEMLQFRQAIETFATTLAAQKRTEADVEKLAALIAKMKHYHKVRDVENYSVADMNFHQEIINCSGNRILAQVYQVLCETIYSQLIEMNTEIGMDLGLGYHIKLFEAIRNRNDKAAFALLNENFQESMREVKTKSGKWRRL